MKRLLPYRTYNEPDVINMFALVDAQANDRTTTVGSGDDGVFVKVQTGNLNLDVDFSQNDFLGKTDYPHVYDNMYPSNPLRCEAATSGDTNILGITLSETVKNDEHGQSLLFNKHKREAIHAVVPGQTVPILSRGVVMLGAGALEAALVVGKKFKISTTLPGKVVSCENNDADAIGAVLGAGTRTAQTDIADKFAGAFALVRIG